MLYELVRRGLLVVVPVVPFLHPRLAKIASARSDDIEAQYGSSSSFKSVKSKIMSLPDNVLLSIMELLPVKDMVCFSMVCLTTTYSDLIYAFHHAYTCLYVR